MLVKLVLGIFFSKYDTCASRLCDSVCVSTTMAFDYASVLRYFVDFFMCLDVCVCVYVMWISHSRLRILLSRPFVLNERETNTHIRFFFC